MLCSLPGGGAHGRYRENRQSRRRIAAPPRRRTRPRARAYAVSRHRRRRLRARQPGHEHATANVPPAHRTGNHLRSRRFRSHRFHGAGMTDLAFMTIAEASRMIRGRKLSPVELTAALLARIAALDGIYHAYIAVTAETALAQAKAAEAEIAAGAWRGPLHGVPYALKDIFDVAGMATTCHSKLRMNHHAAADATVVMRLREAGAVLLGKLALHEFATGGPTRELPWPAALNPWNLDLHLGGSSSGSAVAVATGLAPGALGTDTGGSVRNPATCCGVIGMKPTYGLVSRTGVFPLSFSLDHVGPLTRTVEDNAMLLGAIAGHDSADRSSTTRALADCLENMHAGVTGLRIGVIAHFYMEDSIGSPEQVAAIMAAAEVLRRLGADVQSVRLSPLARWTDCGRTILFVEA